MPIICKRCVSSTCSSIEWHLRHRIFRPLLLLSFAAAAGGGDHGGRGGRGGGEWSAYKATEEEWISFTSTQTNGMRKQLQPPNTHPPRHPYPYSLSVSVSLSVCLSIYLYDLAKVKDNILKTERTFSGMEVGHPKGIRLEIIERRPLVDKFQSSQPTIQSFFLLLNLFRNIRGDMHIAGID